MDAELYAVEVRQYQGVAVPSVLASRLLNPSITQSDRKAARGYGRGTRWTEERFYGELRNSNGSEAVAAFESIVERLTAERRVRALYGFGKVMGSLWITYMGDATASEYRSGRDVVFCSLWSYGSIEIGAQYLAAFAPFTDAAMLEQLRQRLNAIPGVEIPQERVAKRPAFSWKLFEDKPELDQLISVLEWIVSALTAAQKSETSPA